eukprot:364416-Chlamydomonas_euryale.AAC.22
MDARQKEWVYPVCTLVAMHTMPHKAANRRALHASHLLDPHKRGQAGTVQLIVGARWQPAC